MVSKPLKRLPTIIRLPHDTSLKRGVNEISNYCQISGVREEWAGRALAELARALALDSSRLARECAKLDKAQEQKLADEG